jgi:predicted dehydrogenase
MDLIAWFNPSKPVRVSAEGGTLTHENTDVIDNIVSTITFENGSIGAAIIGDCGPGGLPKLSYELIGEGKGAYINNFYELWANAQKKDVKLRIYGGEGYVVGGWDYGLPQEQEAFAKYIAEGGASPVPVEDAVRASRMILKAFESIRTGRPQSLL